MDILKYDFHDGCIFDFIQNNHSIEISMESVEVTDENLEDNLALTKSSTLRGKLHLEHINWIKIDGEFFREKFVKIYDMGHIYSFSIKNKTVFLEICWINRPPKTYEQTDLIEIEIEAEKIYWENIPDLINPYWPD